MHITLLLLFSVSLYILWRAHSLWKAYQLMGHIPGFITFIEPATAIGGSLPPSWFNLGLGFTWARRKYLYKQFDSEYVTVWPLLWGDAAVYVSSPDALKQMMSVGAPFWKPPRAMKAIDIMGPNVVASDGEDWKRQRRITAPAFNPKSYQLVWEETARTYRQMSREEGWDATNESKIINDFNALTRQFAMFIIASCGFGLPLNWCDPKREVNGNWTNREIITQVCVNVMARFVLPWWAYILFPFQAIRDVDHAYKSLDALFHSMISKRAGEMQRGKELNEDIDDKINDVFGKLVQAQVSEGTKLSLQDQEIIGNCFILMLAGHETTAHSLAATLALLALYEDEQEHAYHEISRVIPDERKPTFEDYGKLEAVLACFYEAVRMFPAAYMMFRESKEDTVLPSADRLDGKLYVKQGTYFVLDVIGICYNERYYPEPEKYNPRRWYGSNDRMLAFSTGPRTCIGMKFATTEAVCFLTNLLREWKVEIILNPGETREQWRERVLAADCSITLTFPKVPLRLVRRR